MQIFVDDDEAYLHWVTHHRRGFVIDGSRRPRWHAMVLHRTTCPHVRTRADRRTHWTTAGKFRACADDWWQLQAWATEESGAGAQLCDGCQPLNEVADVEHSPEKLTKLAAEVLDYVLESATIHLENVYPPYKLCVGDIAACFAKTPGQLAAALQQLNDGGWLDVDRKSHDGHWKPRQKIFPTVAALQTLTAYRDSSDSDLRAELAKLRGA
jgi:hypothetical protein